MTRSIERRDHYTVRRWRIGNLSFALTNWGQKRGWTVASYFKVVR